VFTEQKKTVGDNTHNIQPQAKQSEESDKQGSTEASTIEGKVTEATEKANTEHGTTI
jgi:hypothetical protein